MALLESSKTSGAAATPRTSCPRCFGTFHLGKSKCPLDGMSFAKSRIAAKQVQAKIDGGMAVQAAIKEVLESLADG
jgi:hypothetical protein